MEINKKILASNLQYYLELNNLTQHDFAKKTNLTQALVSNYVNAKRKPRMATIEKIAEALGIEVSDLIGKAKCDITIEEMDSAQKKLKLAIKEYLKEIGINKTNIVSTYLCESVIQQSNIIKNGIVSIKIESMENNNEEIF